MEVLRKASVCVSVRCSGCVHAGVQIMNTLQEADGTLDPDIAN